MQSKKSFLYYGGYRRKEHPLVISSFILPQMEWSDKVKIIKIKGGSIMNRMDANEIIQFIANSKKSTPVKVYIKGENLSELSYDNIQAFVEEKTAVLFGEWKEVSAFLEANDTAITDYVVENDRRNSAIPLLDLKNINARIEPGAIIRDQVEIGDGVVIMMGAMINIGAVIGDGTMIDMNAVLGGRATVGKNCHIGAGTVLAGVIEPPSAKPVVVEDDVVIGANVVVLEGVTVGKGAIVAAGAVVTKDVAPHTLVAGTPARVLKEIDEGTKAKTEIMEELRKLDNE
jgi:tetrahydrodipicolinate N-acetyltransferase